MLVENGLKFRFVSLYGKLAAACTGPTDRHHHRRLYRGWLKVKLTKLRKISWSTYTINRVVGGCLNNFTKMHLENTLFFLAKLFITFALIQNCVKPFSAFNKIVYLVSVGNQTKISWIFFWFRVVKYRGIRSQHLPAVAAQLARSASSRQRKVITSCA